MGLRWFGSCFPIASLSLTSKSRSPGVGFLGLQNGLGTGLEARFGSGLSITGIGFGLEGARDGSGRGLGLRLRLGLRSFAGVLRNSSTGVGCGTSIGRSAGLGLSSGLGSGSGSGSGSRYGIGAEYFRLKIFSAGTWTGFCFGFESRSSKNSGLVGLGAGVREDSGCGFFLALLLLRIF